MKLELSTATDVGHRNIQRNFEMTKSKNLQRKSDSLRVSQCKLSSHCSKICRHGAHLKKRQHIKASEKKELQNAVCSVCLEFPHNAVLLLCSSYDKGCRAYMCATSRRFSNCLDQYTKAHSKAAAPDNNSPNPELLCPLCRGQVKGFTVVERVRTHLNRKKRTCMQENCSFLGTYKELRKHVKKEHPLARPREVDPTHVEKWKKLESERDLSDVFSTIRSTIPGAIVIGDYVIERNNNLGFNSDYDSFDDSFFSSRAYGGGLWSRGRFSPDSFGGDSDSFDDDDEDFGRLLSRARSEIPSRRTRIVRSRSSYMLGRRADRLRTGR